MNEKLQHQARQLSEQPYHMVVTHEEIEQGELAFLLEVVEMPGCIAQGSTLHEAADEMKEVLYEYILSYLEHGVQVPAPFSTGQSGGGSTISIKVAINPVPIQSKAVPSMDDQNKTSQEASTTVDEREVEVIVVGNDLNLQLA